MSMDYVRAQYRVPAKRGGRVAFCSEAATIVSAPGALLRIRLDSTGAVALVHPTWRMEYLAAS